MKQKAFYIIAAICCLSLFSAAKQSGKKCDGICCKSLPSPCPKQNSSKAKEHSDYTISPLSFFISL
jgi:hypothetical protein